MPTNDERREVAAKLRELPIDMYEVEERWEAKGLGTDCHDQTDYYLIHFALFGCLPAEHMHPCDYEELHIRLADLIEPEERTCRMTVLENARGNPRHFLMYVCSECHGAVVHDRYDPICFCPNCGRRVVADA